MATTIDRLDLIYCEGWDDGNRAASRPLSLAIVRERESAGEAYAILLRDHGAPTALAEVCARRETYTIWRFDDQQRRVVRYEFRRAGGDELVPAERVQWRYADRHRPEFDHTAPRHTRRCSPDGQVHDIDEPEGPGGASWHRFGRARPWPVRHRLPELDDPSALADLAGAVSAPLVVVGCEPPRTEVAMSPLAVLPWQPPAPSRPARLAPMFDHGARCHLPRHGEVVVEVVAAGRLRLPTGRLVVADLYGLARGVPFTVGVPPGYYPVSVSRLRRVDDPGGPAVVAAVRLRVRTEPVVSWELALRPYRDPGTLGSWQFFGFEVATGTACLADATAGPALARGGGTAPPVTVPPGRCVELAGADPASNLFAFPAGQGFFPTWVGRTGSGEVGCFVADLLRLPEPQSLHTES